MSYWVAHITVLQSVACECSFPMSLCCYKSTMVVPSLKCLARFCARSPCAKTSKTMPVRTPSRQRHLILSTPFASKKQTTVTVGKCFISGSCRLLSSEPFCYMGSAGRLWIQNCVCKCDQMPCLVCGASGLFVSHCHCFSI